MAGLHLLPLLQGANGSTLFPAGDPCSQPLPTPHLESFLPEQWQPCCHAPCLPMPLALCLPRGAARCRDLLRTDTTHLTP